MLCRIDPEIPETVSGDSHRLRQILINLIGNAIKFTENGEIQVRVEKLASDDSGRCRIRFAVKDTGIGIPGEKIDQLFHKFSQVDSSTTRKFGGTGLGLAISRELVDLMGGTIEVESRLDEGSSFSFVLTLPVIEAPDTVPVLAADLHGVHVLIIDDNQANRRILQDLLGRWKMKVSSAESGEEGMALLRRARASEDPVRLLLLDSQMPGMDGFAVAERVRQESSLGEPAIMMVTSEDVVGAASRCRELGIRRYLVKPVRQSELFDAVVETLSGTSAIPTQPVPAVKSYPKAVARRPLRILLAEDNLINLKLAVTLLDRQGWQVSVATDGRQALELWRRDTFDLILMDVQMPELDGIEATRRLRQEEGTDRRIPIIGLTAHALPEDRKACLAAGMDDYVTKPIVPERLFDAVERACLAPEQGEPEDQGTAINLTELRQTVNQDQAFIAEISQEFLSSVPAQLELLQQGLRANDCSIIERTAHSLKAVAGIFGARNASKLAADLEHMAERSDLSKAEQALSALDKEMNRVRAALAEAVPGVI
jgi:CheY-like chemotaxis protein/HPt (histidine-containing phosphotransfer) domain-containing protein